MRLSEHGGSGFSKARNRDTGFMVTRRRQSREVSVLINKLEAARRQLDAAIRLTFSNEDALAIHTLAAAAYRIVRDILHRRGQHDPDELVRHGIHR